MALDDTIVIEEDESEDAEKINDQYIVKGMSKNEAKIDKINIIPKNKVEVLCKPPYVKGELFDYKMISGLLEGRYSEKEGNKILKRVLTQQGLPHTSHNNLERVRQQEEQVG